MRALALVTLSASLVLLVAGCTSSGPGTVATTPAPSSSTPIAPSSSAEVSTPAPETSSAAPVTPSSVATPTLSPPSTRPASTVPPAAETCTASQLSLGVTKGGASLGQEIAVITFTNASTSPCTLSGYPQAILQTSAGMTLGTRADHAAGHVTTVRLAPGKSAQANLTADTRCNAPESSAVRVSAPGVPGATTSVPVQLRACSLHITPVS